MSRNRIALLAIFTVLLSGCGTFCNFAGGHLQPYGGVAKDVEFAAARQASLENQPPRQTSASGHSPLALACILGFCYGDFCASAVADTVTLPFILARTASDNAVLSDDDLRLPAPYSPLPYSPGACVANSVPPPVNDSAPPVCAGSKDR